MDDDDSVSEDESMSEEEDESNAESASHDDASENEEGSGQFTKLVEKHFTVFPDLSETRNIMQCTIQLGKTVKSVVDDKFFEQPLQVQKMMRNLKVVKVIAVIAPRETGAKMMVTMPTPTVTTMTTTEPTLIMSKLQSPSRQKRTRLKKRSSQRK